MGPSWLPARPQYTKGEASIFVVRAFVKLREVLATHKQLARKFAELEKGIKDHDEKIEAIFEAIRQLMAPPEKPRRKIGFEVKEKRAAYGKGGKKARTAKPSMGAAVDGLSSSRPFPGSSFPDLPCQDLTWKSGRYSVFLKASPFFLWA